MISIDKIQPDPENPNVEDIPVFNDLVDDIKADGFLEPILVSTEDGEIFIIISGEHRWKAGKVAGLTELPAVVVQGWDRDRRHIKMIRMNAIAGKFQPEKFTKMYTRLRDTYSEEELRKRIGFGSREAALEKLLKDVTRGMPAGAREQIEQRAEKIRSVEDLATVVQSMYAKHGSTLENNYIIFSFGGAQHVMIRATKDSVNPVMDMLELCTEKDVKADVVLGEICRTESAKVIEKWAKLNEEEEVDLGDEKDGEAPADPGA